MPRSGTNLGTVLLELGHYAEAAVHFRQNQVLAYEIGDQRWLAVNLNSLSRTALHTHDLDGAQRYARQALAVAHSTRCEPDVLSIMPICSMCGRGGATLKPHCARCSTLTTTRPRWHGTKTSTPPCWQPGARPSHLQSLQTQPYGA